MLKIPKYEPVLYTKVLTKEELKEAAKEIKEINKKKRGIALQVLFVLLPISIGILATMPISSPAKEILTAVIVPAIGIFASVYSVLAISWVSKEYALCSTRVYFNKKELSWVELEEEKIALKTTERGLLLETENKLRRNIFLFTKEVRQVERIIKTHIRIRY
ncbi:MAG TPA: hypothetical protein HA346_05855 [Thermoplasmata archaeon]|nr:hypothetical protein [Thermoplasmata archaeon]HIH98509.1 hypothetical protein [Thermoplasmata archaeon]